MIPRVEHRRVVERLLGENRVVALLGARQVGKTTLARQIAAAGRAPAAYFDLESTRDVERLGDPLFALEGLTGLVILDEIQRRPGLFPTLRVLADRRRGARFLVLGSASPALLQQASESLAGRIAFFELPGLSLPEVGVARADRLWLRGGFPRSFTAGAENASRRWREGFMATFLERDLPQLGFRLSALTLRRFWSMLAHLHGQTLNWSELGRSMGVTDMTVRHYTDVLASAFLVRLLPPWHENLAKRQVKAPKIYLRDSGLLHSLLEIGDRRHLEGHPKVGASWEGFCIEVIIAHLGARTQQCFFWGTHGGAELDLLVIDGARRLGFEIKRTSSPRVTSSMRSALEDLGLARIDVVHAGADTYPLGRHVRAVSLRRLLADVRPLATAR